ncbi:MAG: hypothetical protein NT175_04150 [Bacteroidetes bacterium]|nr:hypothetical protein [Bacteroidota bacterium]
MSYSHEEIYALIGRDDKVAVLTFHEDSEGYKMFGKDLTVVFLYNQYEREQFEEKFRANSDESTHGKIKAQYLGYDIPVEAAEYIRKEGINSTDIKSIFPSPWPHENLYHKEEKRAIRKIEIPIKKEPKGGDYDWMYGFTKKLVSDGVGLCPHDREWYLAMKLFHEEKNLSEDESAEIRDNGTLKPAIEEKYLEIKFDKEVITEEEQKRLERLWSDSMNSNFEILKQELNNAGINLKKLSSEKPSLFWFLMKDTYRYIPRHLNIAGARAIYLDFKGFLHVFLRHVQEFEAIEQFKHKDNFLWNPEDVIMVMQKVISSVDDEIQEFWKEKPDQRFSKYGEQSLYFEGDYYTFHIEANGRLSTFHNNRKKI